MRKLILCFVSLLFLGILIGAALIGYEAYRFLKLPPENPGHEVLVDIPPGTTFTSVAEMLEQKGIIRNEQYFRLLAKYKKKLGKIQAGEFKLSTGWPPQRVLDMLVSGQPILYKLSIPEGLTWWQTAEIVEKAGYADFDDFAKAVSDPELLKKYHIPFDNAEGFLFPETYLLKRPDKKEAKAIVELLLKTFWERTREIWKPSQPDAENVRRLVILASLVEKETAVGEERQRIAGVYQKRLERKMLLQCDPTVIYGLGPSFNGNITRKNLEDASNPYNTYQHAGLPPGPIASPGLKSLQAAANPEDHDFLYFVAKGDGSHYFSKSLREHNRAVRKYQLKRK